MTSPETASPTPTSATANPTTAEEEVMAACRRALPADVVGFIDQARSTARPESVLISVLHQVQTHYGYLPAEQLDAVAQLLQVPAARVSGVAGFYHYFRLTPRGRYMISVCLGTACYVQGADRVAEKLKDELGIDFGETTRDKLFSLEPARCLGTCGLAPVIMINDQVHGKVKPEQVPVIIEEYRRRDRD